MLICKDCGFENIEEALFCQQCGAPLREKRQEAEQEESPAGYEEAFFWGRSSEEEMAEQQAETPPMQISADGETEAEEAPAAPKKKRKRWIPFAVLGGVLVLAAAVLLVIRSAADPLKTAKKFMAAMDKMDTNTILKICDCPDVELTEESLRPMFELYASDPDFKEDVAALLKDDVERIREGKHPNVGDMVNLTREKGFPADRYRIRLGSAGAVISSNLPGVEISWNGGTLKLKDGEYDGQVFDLLPGNYQFSGIYTVGSSGETLKAETEERITGYSDNLELNFECIALNIWLPSELILDRVTIGGEECQSLNTETEGCYSIFPAFPDKDITIEAKNKRGNILSETFKIPAGYSMDTYDYQSALSTLSLMLSWPAVLEMQSITVNGQFVDLSDRIGDFMVIDGVTPGENVVMKAKTPWGETVEDSFTAEGSSAEGFISHEWEYTMTETARDEIASTAGRFFLDALNAYHGEDKETLERLSDDFKNEFASTLLLLFNGREEEETYFSYKPIRVVADKSDINQVADGFLVDAAGECDSFLYSKNEKTGKWKKGEKAPYTLSGRFKVVYNKETGNWEVTEGYMTYLTIEDLKEPVEIPVAK